jgi:hypothetical protein
MGIDFRRRRQILKGAKPANRLVVLRVKFAFVGSVPHARSRP